MIPKVIHYCWFGGNPLPKSAQKCIDSWKKYFPDYEIKEWNESNYDVNKIAYISEAYGAKKFAFVSDYARFDIIYNHSGVYFDTDVEVIKPFDDILENGAFMGCEIDGDGNGSINVNPGIGIAAEAGMEFYREILDAYNDFKFIREDGTYNTTTIVKYTTDMLLKNGLQDIKGIQKVCDINIYPKEYFNPLDDLTGKVDKTENTHSIHWYSKTWLSKGEILRSKITKPFHRIFGNDCFRWLKK
ncbi:MAG: glycosyl transferase [Clostridia bacterium]|nr:glycosyl transferase [Clostridia bacterium]